MAGRPPENAQIGRWSKDLAPGGGPPKWFSRGLDRWEGFLKRYLSELEGVGKMGELREIAERVNKVNFTLHFASRGVEYDNTWVLTVFIRELLRGARVAILRRAALRLGDTPERGATD